MAQTAREDSGFSQGVTSPTPAFDPAHTASGRTPLYREVSWNSPYLDHRAYQSVPQEQDHPETQPYDERNAHGLGLSNIPEEPRKIKRVPVGSRNSWNKAPGSTTEAGITPGITPSATPSLPDPRGVFSQATTANNTPADRLDVDEDNAEWLGVSSANQTSRENGFKYISSDGALLDHSHGEHHCDGCPTQGDILKTRMDWFTTTLLILSVYSTIFSAIFLGIAIAKPRWGHKIGTHGSLSFSGATLLSALFSKTVELSFVTVFVATLGQLLSRKAFVRDALSRARGGGISIAEMNLRLWIMQPGTLVTNWIGVRYALPTVLGTVTFIAAISAIFYTTAAEGLVSPKLRMGRWESRTLSGHVSASYANEPYLSNTCDTPIPLSMEAIPGDRGGNCLQIEHAGQGFHNFDLWITQWAQKIKNAQIRPEDTRPAPVAILSNNTQVSGQWIFPSHENVTTDSKRWGRLVQNVTMAMPHTNLFNAVRDPINEIIQPEDLQGAGEYIVKAAIPAPAINVLCAGLSTVELAPMLRDNNTKSVPLRPFKTALDDIFGWQPEGSSAGDTAPWFDKAPKEFNTIGNFTTSWGQSAIYLIAKPPNGTVTNDYILCSMKSMQYPNCTTSYHVAESGGNLTVHCDSDPQNTLPYSKLVPTAPVGHIEKNWKDVAVEWVRAVALTHGVNDGDAAIARILTQMILPFSNDTSTKLKAGLPSYGEGLGVLAGCTLLLSSGDAPFQHEWTFSEDYFFLQQPAYEKFQALVAYKDYASGGSQSYQGIFYVILLTTFVLNCACLVYLAWIFWHYGYVTDYTEPQNLFALAINSPPSNTLAGACGGGPEGHMLRKKWCVDMSRQQNPNSTSTTTATGKSHPHFYVRPTEDGINFSTPQPYSSPMPEATSWASTPASPSGRFRFSALKSPNFRTSMVKDALLKSKTRLQESSGSGGFRASRGPTKLKSMEDLTVDESPAVEQYLRLVGKR